ncbi:hypothetical protein ACHAWF_016517 [Thalassiosira exigua]
MTLASGQGQGAGDESESRQRTKNQDSDSNRKQPPPLDAPTKTSAKSPADISHHVSTLRRLDEEYERLISTEENLEKVVCQLQQEEAKLRLALEQSSTSLKEQREKETKRKDQEAVARLEDALMMDGDDSDETGDEIML